MQQEFLYVYQVFKEGSFSKAAQKLYITQPALSIAIQKIEHAIGLPLFDRSTHPLALTPAVEIYINTIETVTGYPGTESGAYPAWRIPLSECLYPSQAACKIQSALSRN